MGEKDNVLATYNDISWGRYWFSCYEWWWCHILTAWSITKDPDALKTVRHGHSLHFYEIFHRMPTGLKQTKMAPFVHNVVRLEQKQPCLPWVTLVLILLLQYGIGKLQWIRWLPWQYYTTLFVSMALGLNSCYEPQVNTHEGLIYHSQCNQWSVLYCKGWL